jgi:Domain of unknown function (DUF4278)
MRLQYRGTAYEYNTSTLEASETDVYRLQSDAQKRCRTLQEANYPLTYRGVHYTTGQVAAALAVPSVRSSQTLVYRGSQYIRNGDGRLVENQAANGVIAAKVATPSTTAGLTKQLGRIHQDNLRRNLERRLQSAQQQGDQNLIRLLEAESRELAL